MNPKNETGEQVSLVLNWVWLVGIALVFIGVAQVIDLLVAQSHPTGLAEAITPSALQWFGAGLLITLLGLVLRGV
ncbi:MAG: hypothetical protein ABEH81_12050 [Halopenitus sp.]